MIRNASIDHAQNVFWVGDIARAARRRAATPRRHRANTSVSPIEWSRSSRQHEVADGDSRYADANLGVVLSEQRRFPEATAQFASARADHERACNRQSEKRRISKIAHGSTKLACRR